MKNISFFLDVNVSIYLNRCVFVMLKQQQNLFYQPLIRKMMRLLCKTMDQNLVTREAYSHNLCRRYYTWESSKTPTYRESEKAKSAEAHTKAFEYICAYIEGNILANIKVERQSKFRESYLQHLLKHNPCF